MPDDDLDRGGGNILQKEFYWVNNYNLIVGNINLEFLPEFL